MKIFDKLKEENTIDIEENKAGKPNIFKKFFSWYFSSGKINTKLMIIVVVFTIIPCIVTYLGANNFVKNMIVNRYMPSYLDGISKNIEKNINNYLFQINNFSTSVTTQSYIYNVYLNQNYTTDEKDGLIRDYLKTYLEGNSFISNIDIITTEGQVFRYKKQNLTPVKESFQSFIKPSNIVIYDEFITDENNENLFVLGKRIYNFKTGYLLGYMYIYVDESIISSTYKDIVSENQSFFMLLGDRIFSHIDKANIGRVLMLPNVDKFFQIEDTVYNVYKLKLSANNDLPLKLITVTSYTELVRNVKTLKNEIGLISIIAILISFIISIIISRSLIFSINGLKNKMQRFVSGDISEVKFKFREIASLERSFDRMVIEINELIKKNNEEKEKQRIAELKALQAQIDPHFIYNALDAIQWYARIEKQDYIASMVHALASFFRISLHKGESIIKVSEEITHVKSYITIEQMRFPKLFNVIYQIQDDILNCDIPKVILQPIFENCIKHGFEDMEEGGLIVLNGYKDTNSDIIFEVEDNGKGLDCNPLDESLEHKGYGVHNVNQRLKLAYGNDYGLEYRSIKGEYTWVRVKLKGQKEVELS